MPCEKNKKQTIKRSANLCRTLSNYAWDDKASEVVTLKLHGQFYFIRFLLYGVSASDLPECVLMTILTKPIIQSRRLRFRCSARRDIPTLRTFEEITDSVPVIVVISRTERCLPQNRTALLVLSELSLKLRKVEESQY